MFSVILFSVSGTFFICATIFHNAKLLMGFIMVTLIAILYALKIDRIDRDDDLDYDDE